MVLASLQTAALAMWKVQKCLSADKIINANSAINIHTLCTQLFINRVERTRGTACIATESKERQNDYFE